MNNAAHENHISFDLGNKENYLIAGKIAARAEQMEINFHEDRLSLLMDIEATHSNGCPLKLQELLDADEFNFAHDICGIQRHLNRENGKLENCFLPRFAA